MGHPVYGCGWGTRPAVRQRVLPVSGTRASLLDAPPPRDPTTVSPEVRLRFPTRVAHPYRTGPGPCRRRRPGTPSLSRLVGDLRPHPHTPTPPAVRPHIYSLTRPQTPMVSVPNDTSRHVCVFTHTLCLHLDVHTRPHLLPYVRTLHLSVQGHRRPTACTVHTRPHTSTRVTETSPGGETTLRWIVVSTHAQSRPRVDGRTDRGRDTPLPCPQPVPTRDRPEWSYSTTSSYQSFRPF